MGTKQKILRSLGYCTFAISCLFVSIYLTFPGDVMGQRIAYEIALETDGKLQVEMGDVSLYGFTGMSAKEVTLRYQPAEGGPYRVELDEVDVRLEVLPLLTASLVVDGSVTAGNGTIEAAVEHLGDDAYRVDGEIENLDLMKFNFISHMAGLPINGIVSGEVSVDWAKDAKARKGEVSLSSQGLRVGPGELSGGAFGKLTVPKVGFGDLDLGLKMGTGKIEIAKFDQKGGDLQTQISGDVSVRSRFSSSSVSGCVKVKGEPSYLAKNPTLKSVLELVTVRLKKDSSEFLNIPLAGTLGSMRMRGGLCRDQKSGGKGKRRPPPRR